MLGSEISEQAAVRNEVRLAGWYAGVEGGSERVAGGHLMDLWDRLCSMLGARSVSVEDVSNKVFLLQWCDGRRICCPQ